MKRLKVTREAAREIARQGAEPGESALYEAPEALPPWNPSDDVRFCRLQSSWARNAAGIWTATACFANSETRRVDTSFLFPVYCPTTGDRPDGEERRWYFYAIWRGRWESLQHQTFKRIYVGGEYIAVGPYDSSKKGYPIDNNGVRRVKIPGDSYIDTKTLYLNPLHFRWANSSLDIVDKREVSLRVRRQTVVTGIVDGKPVTKSILVIGDA
ncbi:MAG: hypothetical protein ACOX0A_07170 [Thermoguttaceae bacterium]|jgi:hypothetical protein